MASVEEVAEAASMDGAVAPLWFDLEEVFFGEGGAGFGKKDPAILLRWKPEVFGRDDAFDFILLLEKRLLVLIGITL